MLLARREPDDVARPDFLDRAALPLHPADAGGDDQRLAERMGVPGGTRAGLERDAGAATAGRIGRLEQRVDADRAVNQSAGPLADGCEPLRLMSMMALLCWRIAALRPAA